MERGSLFSLSDLPNEILLKLISHAPSASHIPFAIVNKRMNSILEYYISSQRPKKIRLVAENLLVLLVAPYTLHDDITVNAGPNLVKKIPRIRMMSLALSTNKPASESTENIKKFDDKDPFYFEGKTTHFEGKKRGDKQSIITLIEASGITRLRKMLWTKAYSADLCVLIVDPDEIEAQISDISTIIIGACTMMNSTNIVIAVNMSKHVQNTITRQVYYDAKLKLIKATKPMKIVIKIVPVDVERSTNVIEAEDAKFPWFDGPSLTTIVHEDQERTNFDEEEYRKLAEEPLVIHNYHVHLCCRPVVTVGRVIRGTLKLKDIIKGTKYYSQVSVSSIERARQPVERAGPGDRIALSASGLNRKDKENCWIAQNSPVSLTHAFRARIMAQKEALFALDQMYTVFYGPTRVRCILYWMWPENSENFELPYSLERRCIITRIKPKKPTIHPKDIISHRPALKKQRREADAAWFEKACEDEFQVYMKKCMDMKKMFKRPPKLKLPKTFLTAILIPLEQCSMECKRASAFEKTPGTIMITAGHQIVAIGNVTSVANLTDAETKPLMKKLPWHWYTKPQQALQARKNILEVHLNNFFDKKEEKQRDLCYKKLRE